jgi:hypothetical protein
VEVEERNRNGEKEECIKETIVVQRNMGQKDESSRHRKKMKMKLINLCRGFYANKQEHEYCFLRRECGDKSTCYDKM